jgi:hypothetical protein
MADRRPRISDALAERIDGLREDVPFEAYVRDVLERHADHRGDDHADVMFEATRKTMFSYDDAGGVHGYFDRVLNGGWRNDNFPGVVAGFVINDEDYESLGIYFTENDLRAFRDAITEVLKDGPWEDD